jgi:hypothetical protein
MVGIKRAGWLPEKAAMQQGSTRCELREVGPTSQVMSAFQPT